MNPIMKSSLFFRVAVSAFFLIIWAPSFARTQSIEIPHYIGNAFDQLSKNLVYVEEFQETSDDLQNRSARAIYQSPQKKIIAQKDLQFHQNPLIPEYRLEDFRDGYLEGISHSGDSVIVYWRKNRDARLIKKPLVVPEPAVADMGFHFFVQKNWEKLFHGEKQFFNFIVPAQLDYFSFHIEKIKEDRWHEQDVVVYQIELENAFLRLLVAPILVTYHTHTRQPLIVEGLSNINDEYGKNLKVIMTIDYVKDE